MDVVNNVTCMRQSVITRVVIRFLWPDIIHWIHVTAKSCYIVFEFHYLHTVYYYVNLNLVGLREENFISKYSMMQSIVLVVCTNNPYQGNYITLDIVHYNNIWVYGLL